MTGFTFSADQVRAAPPEVRRWIENEVIRALRGPLGEDAPKPHANQLEACSFEDMARIFDLISSNFITVQVFFELGRETPFTHHIPQLHALDFADRTHSAGCWPLWICSRGNARAEGHGTAQAAAIRRQGARRRSCREVA